MLIATNIDLRVRDNEWRRVKFEQSIGFFYMIQKHSAETTNEEMFISLAPDSTSTSSSNN